MTEEGAGGDQKTESDRLEPWIELDGNIVLEAQGKYFRVHRGVLSAYSKVFKDMFDCAQPSDSEELIDKCPIVHLHHDAATDVQVVLKAMYDRNYPAPHYEKVPLPIVTAFIRLGEKYDIQQLFNEGKLRLCRCFESTLSMAARVTSASSNGMLPLTGITDSDPHNFQIMNLLQEMDLRAPLLLAIYQCAVTCPLTAILNGCEYNGTLHMLSRANLRLFIIMKRVIETLRLKMARNLRVSNSCIAQARCACDMPRLWSDDMVVTQPFGPWRHEWDKLFCDPCRLDLKAMHGVVIQRTWDEMPSVLGFGSWREVAKSSDARL